MTETVDSKKRVILFGANPGDRFDVQVQADGCYILTKLPRVPAFSRAKVRFVKRGKYTVGVTDRPLNMGAVKKLLANFP